MSITEAVAIAMKKHRGDSPAVAALIYVDVCVQFGKIGRPMPNPGSVYRIWRRLLSREAERA